jgi:dethiobiotin synthetase
VSVVLVTGTDTGIGKTVVTTAVAAALARRGRRVGVMKPAETGCAPHPEDALALAAAAGDAAELDDVCPYRLPDPLAPMLAAERAGVGIDVAALVARAERRAAAVDVLLVEGAGGVLVPLARDTTFADLAARLHARVLVVVGSRLGAVNHALLTFEALARRGLATVGYVVNRLGGDDDLAIATNERLLETLTRLPRLGTLPWLGEEPDRLLAALRAGGEPRDAARARLATLGEALALERL